MDSFGRMPNELLEGIFDHLTLNGQVALSSTCKRFRAALAPRVFRVLRFTSVTESVERARAAAARIGAHVHELAFKGIRHDSKYAHIPVTNGDLSEAATYLLTGAEGSMPNAKTLAVEFDFGVDDGREEDVEFEVFDDVLAVEDVRAAEAIAPVPEGSDTGFQYDSWRRVMAQTWAAVARNPIVAHLSVEELIPTPTSTFVTEEWSAFLARLESLSLTVLGMESGAGSVANTLFGPLGFVAEMKSYFFDHLRNLKSLSFSGDDGLPVGLSGIFHVPLPFPEGSMPKLERLTLRKMMPGPELVAFLKGKKHLVSLVFENTRANARGIGMASDGISWAEFFDGVAALDLPLQELRVEWPESATLVQGWGPPGEQSAEAAEAARIEEELGKDPKRKVFAYSRLDDKYGIWFDEPDMNREEFTKGDDQRAWDRLMLKVVENQARAAGVPAQLE